MQQLESLDLKQCSGHELIKLDGFAALCDGCRQLRTIDLARPTSPEPSTPLQKRWEYHKRESGVAAYIRRFDELLLCAPDRPTDNPLTD